MVRKRPLNRKRGDCVGHPARLVLAQKYPIGYNRKYLNALLQSSDFDDWLSRA